MVLLIFCVVWQMFCTALECLKSFHARRKVWLQESHPQQNRKSLKTIHKKRRKKKKASFGNETFYFISLCFKFARQVGEEC